MKLGDWRAPILVVALVLGALLAWDAGRTPRPLASDAPDTVFAAGRAMTDDRAMAAKPHAIGSAEAGLVRSYLLQRMQYLGLEPRTTEGVAVEVPRWFKGQVAVGARVENLIGVLKGTDPSLPAVMLMAHSDSVPGSPGAADDAAGVVSALEVVRALKAQGSHKRDVIVLITDGEEAGLLGARAFFASDDPLLKHIGEVVNMEARGGGGRVAMFQLADHDAGHVALFRKAVGNTDANSLTSEVYKYMPNDTDFTVSKNAGYPGYNFAFIGEEFDYHSPSSTPEALDQGALQHMGDQALSITKALVDADTLPAKGPDAAYSDVLGHMVLAYPAVLGGWIILILAIAIAGVSVWRGQQLDGERGVRPGPMVWGFVGALLITLVVAAILWAASRLVGLQDFAQHRRLLAQYPWFFSGFVLLALGAALFLAGPVQRGKAWTLLMGLKETRWSSWGGVFLLVAILGVGIQATLPPIAVLIAWPLLAASLVMAGCAFLGGGRLEGAASMAIAGVIGLLAIAHLGHFADQTFTAVGEMAPELLALFVLLLLPVLYPLLLGWGRRGMVTQLASVAVLVMGMIVAGYAALHDAASARTPRAVQAFYLQDSVVGKSWRASGFDALDGWSAGVLRAGGSRPERHDVPALNGKLWVSPTAEAGIARPKFTSSRDGDAVVVHIAPQGGGRELRLTLSASSVAKNVSLDGHPVSLLGKANAPFYVRWSAPGDGLTLRFTPTDPKGELHLLYAEVKDGWPVGHVPEPKPPRVMSWGLSDTTVVTDELKTKW